MGTMYSSQHVYMLRVEDLWPTKKMKRTRDNCFLSHDEFRKLPGETDEQRADRTREERQARWDELYTSIKSIGVRIDNPIELHLLRKDGKKDQISKGGGHHRLSIAKECGHQQVPVRIVFECPIQQA